MLPTRMVKTSGRSSSAIEARWPSAIARSYSSLALPRSFSSASMTRPSAVIRIDVTAGAVGQREDVRGLQRDIVRVVEVLR